MNSILSWIQRYVLGRPFLRWMLRPVRRVTLHVRVLGESRLRPKLSLESFREKVRSEAAWSEYLSDVRTRDRPRFFFHSDEAGEIAEHLKGLPEPVRRRIVETADRVCENTFDLLGYGPVALGPTIDWHRDPVSGGSWKPSYHRLLSVRPREDGADARVVWELNRFQFLALLGQAWWLTGDAKYARKSVGAVSDWIEKNPCPYGINWVSPMEAAIRSVNWIWAFHFMRASSELSDEFVERFLLSLYEHAAFIENNIEKVAEVTTNHTIANYLGLFFTGLLFPDFDRSADWLRMGSEGLWGEALAQVRGDGVQYESSTYYHGFVAEMLVSALLLARANGIEVPGEVEDRIRKMIGFTHSIVKPDGTIPLVGDSDDGRLVRLESWADRPPADQRWLLGLGGEAFDCEEWLAVGEGPWHGTNKSYRSYRSYKKLQDIPAGPSARRRSQCFGQSGFAVMRDGDHFTICCAEPAGAKGIGNHQHNDWLSFELAAFGQTFLIDCGTYVYSGNPDARNRFRSTAAHNTVRVDGCDIVEIPREQLFGLFGDPGAKIVSWESTDEYDRLEACHEGYRGLASPVRHRRILFFEKRSPFWVIDDRLEGEGRHELEWFFHFDPGVDVAVEEGRIAARAEGGLPVLVIEPESLEIESLGLSGAWISRSYGRCEQTKVLCARMLAAELPMRLRFVIQSFPGSEIGGVREAAELLRTYEAAGG